MKASPPLWAKNISTVGPHRACASFVYTFKSLARLPSMAKCKKPEFRSLSTDLGHFLTSDVILIENFCRLASIWLIGLMKLFALGRTDLAGEHNIGLAGKVAKFTEMAIITLRIFEFCRSRVTPSGPPSALASSTEGRVLTPARSQQSRFIVE